jgi:hypothetical protein
VLTNPAGIACRVFFVEKSCRVAGITLKKSAQFISIKTHMKKIILLSILVASVATVKADNPFFQASLTPDIAVQSKSTEIDGICLSIWGENPQHAFALGFVNGSTGDSQGVSLGFFVNYADSYTGLDWAMVNLAKQKFTGVQLGMVNVAKEFHGLQWGLINYTENLRGVQIGLANIAINNSWFENCPDQLAKGFPFVNWSF